MLILLGLACAPGPNLETLVPELRVMAVVPDAAEYGPGDSFAASVWVVDPERRGFDVVAWACTPVDEATCLEDVEGQTNRFTSRTEADAETALTGQIPSSIGPALSVDDGLPTTSVWVLACVPGTCPAVDDPTTVVGALRVDPSPLLQDLPITGVSLARFSLWASNRPSEERHRHPTVDRADTQRLEATSTAPLSLAFDVTTDGQESEATAFGYATGGGFAEVEGPIVDGAVTLDWYGPESATKSELLVLVRDDLGGVALWRGAAVSSTDDADLAR